MAPMKSWVESTTSLGRVPLRSSPPAMQIAADSCRCCKSEERQDDERDKGSENER